MNRETVSSLKRLQSVLSSAEHELPIYTRFQTKEQYVTVGVHAVAVAGGKIVVEAEDNRQIVIDSVDLVAIIAFKDAGGRSVFLTDFGEEPEFYEGHVREIETLTNALHRQIREWQEMILDVAQIDKNNQQFRSIMPTKPKANADLIRTDISRLANIPVQLDRSWEVVRNVCYEVEEACMGR